MALSSIARTHFEAAAAEAAKTGYPRDDLARAMLAEVIRAYISSRPLEDVARELIAAADNLDPEKDYAFMRP